MTGNDLKKLRHHYGLSLVAFGEVLGIGGEKSASTLAREIRRLEKADHVPSDVARMVIKWFGGRRMKELEWNR